MKSTNSNKIILNSKSRKIIKRSSKYLVNPTAFGPYKNFKFKVKWDGKYIVGVNKISALKRTTEVIEQREGEDPNTVRKLAGKTKYEPIILERGLSHDHEFENWAKKTLSSDTTSSNESQLKNFIKDIILEIFDKNGRSILTYKIYRCWVSEYQAVPELKSNSSGIPIEAIIVQNEGWERDDSVGE